MTRTTLNNLQKKLQDSTALKLLVPSYQKQLQTIANAPKSDFFAEKMALQKILDHESGDLESLYFVEEQLEKFVEDNLPVTDQQLVLREFQQKAAQLMRTFLFFEPAQTENFLKQMSTITMSGLRQMIELLREGHRKQNDYLMIFAEKDPLTAIKFELIVKGKSGFKKKK